MLIIKMKNKKGQSTIFIAMLILGVFLTTIVLLVVGLVVTNINSALDIDVDIGQVNLGEENANTFGKFNEMIVVSADWWGTSIIFGLVFGLFLSAYFVRGSFPKWGIMLDIFLILFAFIISLYISSAYQEVINVFASIDETFLEDTIPKTSMFVLNLPIFVPVIGVIMMILFHSSIPRRTEDRIQEGGFLRGVQ